MTIKAILDTNVFVSGIFWKGAPFEILQAWQKQCFRLAISPPILEEYRRNLFGALLKMNRQANEMALDSGTGLVQRKYLAQFWHSRGKNGGSE